jgi:DNA-binding NarL/FixJ family response regulator
MPVATAVRRQTTILLVDDHAMVRAGIKAFLEQQPDIKVVVEADNGRDAVTLAAKFAPDIVLLDLGMAEMNGIEAARRIHAHDPDIAIIALTVHADSRYVTGFFNAGGKGYLLKTCESEELLRAIDAIKRGHTYITPDVAHILAARQGTEQGEGPAVEGVGLPAADVLTPKEREVLQLIAEGITSKGIAERLGTSIKTAETHRSNLMRKLGLHSIAALTRYAIKEGISSMNDAQ